MKIAVTGKGGVGKSTISAVMARVLKEAGHKVLLIDADPDMNSASILGVPDAQSIQPIRELKELIAERTGTEVGRPAPLFKMNPQVSDIPDKYCREHEGIKVLVMGTIVKGGGGCACPENAFLKTLLSHLILARDEWVILDMEAGIEHLGRGTALGVDEMFVVVEPSQTSIETAQRVRKLSSDIGIKNLRVIGNKVQNQDERAYLEENLQGFDILGYIEYSDEIRKINLRKATALSISGKPVENVKALLERGGWLN